MEKFHGFIIIEDWTIESDIHGVLFGRRRVVEMVGYVGFYRSFISMLKLWGMEFEVLWL